MTKTIKIKAADTLSFKDGKPFLMGEETYADAVFPPLPSVLYGFLRNLYITNQNINLHQDVKTFANLHPVKESLNLEILKNQLLIGDQLLFPLPEDVKFRKLSTPIRHECHYTELKKSIFTRNEHKMPEYLLDPAGGKPESNTNLYLTYSGMVKYASGASASELLHEIIYLPNYITNEYKVGMGREKDTKTAEEGKLYTVKMIRPETDKGPLSFFIEYKGIPLIENEVGRLGSDGKIGFLEVCQINSDIKAPVLKSSDNMVKMLLTSPGIFNNGWQPSIIPEKIKIIAFSSGRPLTVGGWDMAAKRPKPMLTAVPAGAIYVLSGATEDLQEFITNYHGKVIGETINSVNYKHEGYGHILFAQLNQSQLLK